MQDPIVPIPAAWGPDPSEAGTDVPAPDDLIAQLVEQMRSLPAVLLQLDHLTGLRGWLLQVHDGLPAKWPRHHFSRAGVRPPLPGARLLALRELGYEPIRSRWNWDELVTADGKHVLMAAAIDVRRLVDTPAEVAPESCTGYINGCLCGGCSSNDMAVRAVSAS